MQYPHITQPTHTASTIKASEFTQCSIKGKHAVAKSLPFYSTAFKHLFDSGEGHTKCRYASIILFYPFPLKHSSTPISCKLSPTLPQESHSMNITLMLLLYVQGSHPISCCMVLFIGTVYAKRLLWVLFALFSPRPRLPYLIVKQQITPAPLQQEKIKHEPPPPSANHAWKKNHHPEKIVNNDPYQKC